MVLPVTGAATGVAQVVRGIANQPEAAKATTEGKVWDQVHTGWAGIERVVLLTRLGC